MTSLTIVWWNWLIFGLALMVAELVLPSGFFLFFFGVGGVTTAILGFFGLSSFIAQGLAFVGVSLLCVAVLRKPMLTKFHFGNRTHVVDSIVGEIATSLETIKPKQVGRVEMRGSSWSALNTGSDPIAFNVRCRVEKVEGLTLHVKP